MSSKHGKITNLETANEGTDRIREFRWDWTKGIPILLEALADKLLLFFGVSKVENDGE